MLALALALVLRYSSLALATVTEPTLNFPFLNRALPALGHPSRLPCCCLLVQ